MASDSIVGEMANSVTLDTLVDRLGRDAAQEFFGRIDGTLREGQVIYATNVRESRTVFSKARHQGQAQLVVSGRARKGGRGLPDVGDSVVIIKMDDLEAVVRAGQSEFDWAEAFSPRGGLQAASTTATIVPGSRGRRQLLG